VNAFERMKLREKSTGSTIREELTINSSKLFANHISDDPSFRLAEILRNDTPVGSISLRMDNYKLYSGIPRMNIHDTLSNGIKFRLGDVFHTSVDEEDSKERYWLCIDENNFHNIQRDGLVEGCNHYLRWQNIDTLEIIGRWCSFRSPYSSGITAGDTIANEAAKYSIIIPYDSETELLGIDRRFLIGHEGGLNGETKPMAFKVIEYNPVSSFYQSTNEGFLEINLRADAFNLETDNAELMIANYRSPESPQPTPIGSCRIISPSSKLVVRQGGTASRFVAEFLDPDNNLIDGIFPTWKLLLPEKLNGHIIMTQENETVISLIASNDAPIGEVLEVQMIADGGIFGEFKAMCKIEVIELW
jgi:hypothetical protein